LSGTVRAYLVKMASKLTGMNLRFIVGGMEPFRTDVLCELACLERI
jgi:hypothetical protein